MGFWGSSFAGLGFLGMGLWKAYTTAKLYLQSSSSECALDGYRKRPFYLPELLLIAGLSLAHILNAALFSDSAKDLVGSAMELEKLGVASIFLLYAVAGIIAELTRILPLPAQIHHLVGVLAFLEEFVLFYLPREGSDGSLQNRYYALMLVPISVCVIGKALEIPYPGSVFPPLGLSAGLILQGTWLLQMGLSFFTFFRSNGCNLRNTGGAGGGLDYDIKCSHASGHRAMAVATLQFNGHLALLLVCLLLGYSFLGCKYERCSVYRPLGEELQNLDKHVTFALDSDDDEATAAAPVDAAASEVEVNSISRVSV